MGVPRLPAEARDGRRPSGSYRLARTGGRPVDADLAVLARLRRASPRYNKTALWLHTLERMLGWDTLQRILSTYYSRWAFRHPKPDDFFAVVNEVSGRDMTWFFDQVYRSSNVFDYGVDAFISEPADGAAAASATAKPGTSRSADRDRDYRTTVAVRRFGEAVFPVDVRVVFENGEEIRWQWDGRDRRKLFEVEKPVARLVRPGRSGPRAAARRELHEQLRDAEHRSRRRRPANGPSTWLVWLQDHLLTYGFFV